MNKKMLGELRKSFETLIVATVEAIVLAELGPAHTREDIDSVSVPYWLYAVLSAVQPYDGGVDVHPKILGVQVYTNHEDKISAVLKQENGR